MTILAAICRAHRRVVADSAALLRFQYSARLGLQNREEVQRGNVGFVLRPLLGSQGPGSALFRQLIEMRLSLRIQANRYDRLGHIRCQTAADGIENSLDNRNYSGLS